MSRTGRALRPEIARWLRGAGVVAALATLALAYSDVAAPRPAAVAAAGDAARGSALFARLPCASCHDITRPWPGGDVCPNLGNIATEAARIVRGRNYHGKARDAAGYIRESILDPNAYIVPGAAYRMADGQSVMPKNFRETLKPSELDDLVAFLLTKR
jgi:nitric oxide reductase subunit C